MAAPPNRHGTRTFSSTSSFHSPATMHRPHPSDDLPEVVIGLDNFAEVRHRPDCGLRVPARVAQLPERVAGTELTCAERNQPEKCVVVIAIDPIRIGEGHRHAAAAASPMAAIAACSHVLAMAFLGDAGEVRVGALQLAFGCASFALHRCHGLPGRYITASCESGYDQAHENSAASASRDAAQLDQHAVTSFLDDTASRLGDLEIDELQRTVLSWASVPTRRFMRRMAADLGVSSVNLC